MRLGKALVENDAPQGVGEVAAGTVGKMPVNAGSSRRVTGGAAQRRSCALGVAGGKVDAGAFQVKPAAMAVVGYVTDGRSSFSSAWIHGMDSLTDLTGLGFDSGRKILSGVTVAGVRVAGGTVAGVTGLMEARDCHASRGARTGQRENERWRQRSFQSRGTGANDYSPLQQGRALCAEFELRAASKRSNRESRTGGLRAGWMERWFGANDHSPPDRMRESYKVVAMGYLLGWSVGCFGGREAGFSASLSAHGRARNYLIGSLVGRGPFGPPRADQWLLRMSGAGVPTTRGRSVPVIQRGTAG